MRKLLFEQRENGKSALAPFAAVFSFLIAFAVLTGLVAAAFAVLDYHWDWSSAYQYREKFLNGWKMTILLSAGALVASCLIGGLSALSYRASFLPLRYLSKIYVTTVRGTPLLVQTLIIFYVFADAIHLENRYVVGVIILSVFSGAYVSEIFRAGIAAVGASQLLSARAIGFTPAQTFRYITMPQALRHSLPALAGQFANLIKDSSLLSIIAVGELTLKAQEVNSLTYSAFESYFPLAVGYLLLTLPVFYLSRLLEKRLAFET